jgi:hypothetical protein
MSSGCRTGSARTSPVRPLSCAGELAAPLLPGDGASSSSDPRAVNDVEAAVRVQAQKQAEVGSGAWGPACVQGLRGRCAAQPQPAAMRS